MPCFPNMLSWDCPPRRLDNCPMQFKQARFHGSCASSFVKVRGLGFKAAGNVRCVFTVFLAHNGGHSLKSYPLAVFMCRVKWLQLEAYQIWNIYHVGIFTVLFARTFFTESFSRIFLGKIICQSLEGILTILNVQEKVHVCVDSFILNLSIGDGAQHSPFSQVPRDSNAACRRTNQIHGSQQIQSHDLWISRILCKEEEGRLNTTL